MMVFITREGKKGKETIVELRMLDVGLGSIVDEGPKTVQLNLDFSFDLRSKSLTLVPVSVFASVRLAFRSNTLWRNYRIKAMVS